MAARFSDRQAGAHAELVTPSAAVGPHGSDQHLKACAAETLPKLESHRMHIDEIVAQP